MVSRISPSLRREKSLGRQRDHRRHVESALTPAERISLIGDKWAQLRANKATVGDYLNLVSDLKSDPNFNVVASALSGLDAIDRRIASTPEEKSALDSCP